MARADAAGPAAPEDDPRALAAQFEFLQRQLQAVDRRLAQIEQALVESQQAASAVEALAASKGTQDTLLPLGSGVHVHAKLDPRSPVLLPIGAGYFTEGPAAEVTAALKQRIEALTKSFQQTSEDAERLAQTAGAINDRLTALSQS